MIIKFDGNLTPKNIRVRIYRNLCDTFPYFEKSLNYDFEKHQILFEEKYPIYTYRYIVVWEFDE